MPDLSYPVPQAGPQAPVQSELVIRRSRFLTSLARTDSPAEARAFIDAIRTRYADATHNCWAFVAGPPGSTAQIGASDDGEPHGTAGRPMLQVLLHCGAGCLCAVVTRWFGGVKLGTGGLVRAYQDSVAAAIERMDTVMRTAESEISVILGYPDLDRVRRLLSQCGGRVTHEDYAADVTLTCLLPTSEADRFTVLAGDATDGRAIAEVTGATEL